jgi:hypothetical protein
VALRNPECIKYGQPGKQSMNSKSQWHRLAAASVLIIGFIVVVWSSESGFLVNVGFLVLGVLLAVAISFLNDVYQRTLRSRDLARLLHTELSDLVARCCFDSEASWSRYWASNLADREFNVISLRKFAPGEPVIFRATAGELAILHGDAPLRLVQFHYRLNALSREIENIANDSTEANRVEPISKGALRLVGLRMRQTLKPGLDALQALAQSVPDADQIEASAIDQYDATRKDAPPGH